MLETEVPNCTTCGKTCTNRFNDRLVFYYETNPFCGKCYHSMVCSYCDPPKTLNKCEGHIIEKNPSNRFLKDKEFVDGTRFEYETDRTLRPPHIVTR